METVGSLIKKKRKELGLTQRQLAEKLNVTQQAVAQFEKSINLGTDTLKKIADALGCNMFEFIVISSRQILNDFDPRDYIDVANQVRNDIATPLLQQQLIDNFNELNLTGKHEAAKRVEELTYIEKYRRD